MPLHSAFCPFRAAAVFHLPALKDRRLLRPSFYRDTHQPSRHHQQNLPPNNSTTDCLVDDRLAPSTQPATLTTPNSVRRPLRRPSLPMSIENLKSYGESSSPAPINSWRGAHMECRCINPHACGLGFTSGDCAVCCVPRATFGGQQTAKLALRQTDTMASSPPSTPVNYQQGSPPILTTIFNRPLRRSRRGHRRTVQGS